MGLGRAWTTIGEYFGTSRSKSEWGDRFAELERFVIFLGYPRSGHSLLGSVLDAHPEMILAHEQDVLRYLKYGFDRQRIMALLMRNSMRAAQKGRDWSGYSYRMPDQYQGTFRRLRAIGDKKGANTTRRLAKDPTLLDHLEEKVGLPIRIVHVKREPLDNISRMVLRDRTRKGRSPSRQDIRKEMEHYLHLRGTVEDIRQGAWEECFIDIELEGLIADPYKEIGSLLEKLHMERDEGHLKASSDLVFDMPRRASSELEWPEDLKEELLARLDR